jgi:hypothetical protein
MRHIITFIFSILLGVVGIDALADTLPDEAAVRKLADGTMGSVGAGNIAGTISQIKPYLALPKAAEAGLEADLQNQYVAVLVQVGSAVGSEFVRQDKFGSTLMRLVYLAKYERGAMRWVFYFYKGSDGWMLSGIRLDRDLDPLFDHG